MKMFKEKEHTADLALEVEAESMESLFSESARGMFYLMYGKIKNKKKVKFNIDLDSFSNENLLVDFLNELLYLNETRDFILSSPSIKIKNNSLNANLYGYTGKEKKISIKAATYHNLKITKRENLHRTQITFDV